MDSADQHCALARAALNRFATGFAVSHLSAAAAHGLPMPLGPIGPVHLTAIHAVQHSRRASGVVVHHSDSTIAELATASGLVVTGVARTVADCLRTLSPQVSVPIGDAAMRDLGLTTDELATALAAQAHWRGLPRALRWSGILDGRRESWLESFAAVRFVESGIEVPTPQVTVLDGRGRFVARVDGAWVRDATVLEVDGRAKYAMSGADPRRSFFLEKRRHNDLVNLGLAVARCELVDLRHRLAELTLSVTDARRRGRAGQFRGTLVVPPEPGSPSEDMTRRQFAG